MPAKRSVRPARGAAAVPPEAPAGDDLRYKVPALERGLDVLEHLADAENGETRADLARALGCSISQVFRVLDCLQRRGYIAAGPANSFVLTPKLFELSHRHPPTRRLVGLALPIMRAAAQKARQSVQLVIFADGEMLVLSEVDAPEDVGIFIKPGTRRDVFLTASGRVLLAFQPREERAGMLAVAEAATPKLMPRSEYEKRLDVVRLQGFEEMPSFQIAGVHNISFPVLDVAGRAVAAMTMPFLRRSDIASDLGTARDALREAAGTSPVFSATPPKARRLTRVHR